MKTLDSEDTLQTVLTDADREILGRVLMLFGPFVEVEPIGRYRTMGPDDLWLTLVGQVCVRGGAGPWDRLQGKPGVAARFGKAISLAVVGRQEDRTAYLAGTLRGFSATRFHNTGGECLVSVIDSPGVFREGNCVLFEDLSDEDDPVRTREAVIRRCPVFGLKSASDFMISVGLSHDVIALDTRVVGVFQKYLGYNLAAGDIQGNRRRYLSLEAALRELCDEQDASLALLDRLLFRLGNAGAMEVAVQYPELWKILA